VERPTLHTWDGPEETARLPEDGGGRASLESAPDDRPGLKISELAQAAGVSPGTVKHYLREGLLGHDAEIVRTSRNMAWYPPEHVERIRLIKRLQGERHLPLREIRELLADRQPRTPRVAVELSAHLLDRLAELGMLTPDQDGYDPYDVAIIAALARSGDGELGLTVEDALRCRDALRPLVQREAQALRDVEPERATALVRAGHAPLRDWWARCTPSCCSRSCGTSRGTPGDSAAR
jgi:DNA-binding transcriptional MerR regulator